MSSQNAFTWMGEGMSNLNKTFSILKMFNGTFEIAEFATKMIYPGEKKSIFTDGQITTFTQNSQLQEGFSRWITSGVSLRTMAEVIVSCKKGGILFETFPDLKILFPEIFKNISSVPSTNTIFNIGTINGIAQNHGSATFNFTNATNSGNSGYSMTVDSQSQSQSQSGNKVGSAFAKLRSKKELTVRDFFTEKDGIHANAARDLIKHLDETGYWEQLMALEGLMEDEDIAAEVVKWKFDWKKNETSATKRMLNELLPNEWGDEKMKTYAQNILSNKKCPNQVINVLQTWLAKIDGKEKDAIDAGTNRYENANNLNTFFVEHVNGKNVFKDGEITLLVAHLQDECITDLTSLSKLVKSHPDLLKSEYKLKTGQIFAIQEALDKVQPPAN